MSTVNNVPPHDHNGKYVRRESCDLQTENVELKIRNLTDHVKSSIARNTQFTLAVLSMQVAVIGLLVAVALKVF